MKIERSIVKRDANRPELAQGERILVELDPDKLRRMFEASDEFLKTLERLALGGRRRRRPRKRS